MAERGSRFRKLKAWAGAVKRDIRAIYLARRDPRLPWYVKALAAVVIAYALSPIDLIPDFIPIIGYLDDLILLPLAVLLIVRLVPTHVMMALRAEAERDISRVQSRSRTAASVIVLAWLAGALLLWSFIIA